MALSNQVRENLLHIRKSCENDKVICLAGNPNVGKSTVFNQLTGLRQHTGNWAGKTVTNAQGYCSCKGQGMVWVDVPGCYSLTAHSAEEEAARDFICFGGADVIVVVCDAVCLERGMNLVLQVLEVCPRVVVCVNLMDEAARKGIALDLTLLEKRLGVPVVGTAARSGQGLDSLLEQVCLTAAGNSRTSPLSPQYDPHTEQLVHLMFPAAEQLAQGRLPARWLAVRLLEQDSSCIKAIGDFIGTDPNAHPAVRQALAEVHKRMVQLEISPQALKDNLPTCLIHTAEVLCQGVAEQKKAGLHKADRQLDRLFTSRLTGFPIMFFLLMGIFWLTITGANYPSRLLSGVLFGLEEKLYLLLSGAGAAPVLCDMLCRGAYRVLAWVVSVMLPPMAIFFPLFTLLEDSGYLPRVAFNLDKCFQKCRACGKQALTMCMAVASLLVAQKSRKHSLRFRLWHCSDYFCTRRIEPSGKLPSSGMDSFIMA